MNGLDKISLIEAPQWSHRYRDWLLLFASMFSLLAGAAVAPALPAMAAYFSHVPNVGTLTKLTLSTTALFIAAGAGPAGWLIDRVGRKPVLAAGALITGIAGTSGAALDSLHLILVSRALLGLGVACVVTSATTLIGDVIEPARQASFFGRQSAAMKVGGILFLLIGGVLTTLSWRAVFLVDLLAFAILPGVLSGFPEAPRCAVQARARLSLPWRNPQVLGPVFATFACQLFFYMIPTQVPFHLATMVKAAPMAISLAIALNLASAALVATQIHRMIQWIGARQVYALSLLTMALGFGLIGLGDSYGVFVCGLLIAGMGTGTIFPCAAAGLVSVVGEAQRGRVTGLLVMMAFAGQFVSPLILAPLVQAVGIGQSFLAAAAALIACAVIVLLWLGAPDEQVVELDRTR